MQTTSRPTPSDRLLAFATMAIPAMLLGTTNLLDRCTRRPSLAMALMHSLHLVR